AELANLLIPLGWQYIPAGQSNIYVAQYQVPGGTVIGTDSSITFIKGLYSEKVNMTAQCLDDQCGVCSTIKKTGKVLIIIRL
ncbi:MAG: hypothetical protein OQK93_01745, partial [Gammaproteobacteria bacterium]|nr:hypothetical protein [Gammaproteobacteria bacterium]